MDVALGGQGAPLVPVGDHFLFGDYDACLNIGGIANISFVNPEGKRVAFDICVANMLLNELAQQLNEPFDKGGMLASKGTVLQDLLEALNKIGYYNQQGAKSIGREWYEKNIRVLLENKMNPLDLLATCTEHIASVIGKEFEKQKIKNVLITGGGTYNTFLIERIKTYSSATIVIPGNQIIEFKEALIFAFLGYLRVTGKNNALASVTGAKWDSCGGAVHKAGGI
jgi:anhydro-N-acetylmuramic acid kinase